MAKYTLRAIKNEYEDENEKQPDLANCEDCPWSGKVAECDQDEDGTWEYGYFIIDICPKCGGPIEYSFSEDQANEC